MKLPLGLVGLLALGCTAAHVSSHELQGVRPVPTSCDSTRSADTVVYDSAQLSERAAPRSVPEAVYPAYAKKHKVQGRVVVAAIVNADGHVDSTSVEVRAGADSLLDAEARRIVLGTTFWPACRDRVAVRSHIVAPFDFKVTGDTEGVVIGALAGAWAGVMVIMGVTME